MPNEVLVVKGTDNGSLLITYKVRKTGYQHLEKDKLMISTLSIKYFKSAHTFIEYRLSTFFLNLI